MSTQVQVRGATNATQQARTLASRELDVDTTNNRISIHNGSTAGGIEHCTYVDAQNQTFTYASATGTNAIAVTLSPAPTAYTAGMAVSFKAAATTTGAATLNLNSLGAKNIYKKDTSTGTVIATETGDIVSGGVYTVIYDGTQFQLTGGVSSGTSGTQWEEIDYQTFSGVTSIEVASADWSDYAIVELFIDLDQTSTSIARLRVSDDAGATYESGASNYDWSCTGLNRSTGADVDDYANNSSITSYVQLAGNTNIGGSFSFHIKLFNPANTYEKNGWFSTTTQSFDLSGGFTFQGNTNDINGIQVSRSGAGTWTGIVKAIGLRKT